MSESIRSRTQSSFIKGVVTGVIILGALAGVYFLGVTQSGKGNKVGRENVGSPTINQPAAQPQQPTTDGSKIAKVDKSDHIRGDSNAKITMIEYSDFECPFCARFQDTVEQVLAEYKGQVRLVYRHFPLSFHPSAQKAAEASECAADQDSFWEMHDKLFELNGAKNLGVASIKKAALDLGLNSGEFDDCLDSGKYAEEVQKDYQDGLAGGVSGTPGTFVEGEYIAGALPYASVKAIIDSKI
jgi:protein-disulfide isomerase